MKRCHACNIDKPESEFHKETARKDGLASQCKMCRSAWYKKTYPSRREQVKANTQAYRQGLTTRVLKYKQKPCMDCGGVFPPCAMDFDHRDDAAKVASIARLVTRGPWSLIEAEIAKCDLVCANCHRIRTFRRLYDRGAVPKWLTELPAKQLFAGSIPAGVSEKRRAVATVSLRAGR